MEQIIIILLLTTIALLIYKNIKLQKTKPKMYINIGNSEYTESYSNKLREDSRKQLYTRDRRRKRHTRIWSVLRFMVTYNDLMNSKNFYDIRNGRKAHEEAKGRMRKEHVEENDIETAIRFCRMENFYGTCQYSLNNSEIEQLYKWQNIQISEKELLNNVLESYQSYWNEVLNSYKRPSARKNRLNYLIEDLDEVLSLPYIQEYPDITEKIKALQYSYSVELTKH